MRTRQSRLQQRLQTPNIERIARGDNDLPVTLYDKHHPSGLRVCVYDYTLSGFVSQPIDIAPLRSTKWKKICSHRKAKHGREPCCGIAASGPLKVTLSLALAATSAALVIDICKVRHSRDIILRACLSVQGSNDHQRIVRAPTWT